MKIDDDATLWAMTFNGTVPGPAIVAHEGDYVEVTLVNPSTNALKHNVDFHAATGAMGGGDFTFVSPGEQAKIRFRATKSGTFYYHCAPGGMMNPSHIVAGMNGTIIILPREGLKDEHDTPIKYDKAFYITEQDYYIPKDENGNYIDYDNIRQTFADYNKAMMTLMPTHVVFNGAVGALSGENALTAKVGEKVLFITTAANIDTRLHLIGGHVDLVWLGGSFNDKPVTNYETWPVVAGSAAAAIYQFRQPGKYILINHNMIIGNGLGANAEIQVEGAWDNDLMKQIEEPKKIEE